MFRGVNIICFVSIIIILLIGTNGICQSPSVYALIPLPVMENPTIWKMTKSLTNSLWGKNLFSNPYSASQSYVMDTLYNLYTGVSFELDHDWNRMIYSECKTNWIRAYGTFGSGTGQFNWPKSLDAHAPSDAYYYSYYYYIYIADTGNDRIVKLKYNWLEENQSISSDGMITGNGLDLPQDLDINNGFDFLWRYNDYLWILNGNSQIKRYDLYEDTFMCTYGSYGSGEGQFRHPTAVVSGRGPFIVNGDPYANNDHFYIADRGNNRLVWLIKTHAAENITWYKELYLDGDIIDLEVDNFGQVWAVDRSNGQFIKYTYDLIPLCTFGSSGFGENQFWKPVSISNTGGYLAGGNMYVLESWTDSSGGQYFVIGTDIVDFSVYSNDEHTVHYTEYIQVDPAGIYFKIYNESEVLVRTVKPGVLEYSGPTLSWWDGKDDAEQYVPSGNYLMQVSAVSIYANVSEPGYPRADSITREGWVCNVHPDDIIGDANGDGSVSVSDVVYLIDYLFKNGPAPDPLWKGDVNGYCGVTLSDIVYLNYYLFSGGAPPQLNFSCSPPWNCQL